ncbi:hypothetical protein JM658_11390 [Joostella atrarenae]|uniref:Uncharacterized protein n=1 Tax=Joostella atrarenae TaxID=679257 RepID=A0ABS9J4T8_9FLAO|nr:hypothetical protein [Joostella atrarenae]MCF8715432.1 hypothetical protein [Joostella atrarenae]
MKKIILSASMLLVIAGAFVSCKETTKEKEVIVKEAPAAEEEDKGVLERVGEEVDTEVNEEIDETIEKIGDE